MNVASNNAEPSFMIDDHPFFKVDNVTSVSCTDDWSIRPDYGWDVEIATPNENDPHADYFYIDCPNLAFGHWIFESSHLILLYKKLKTQYPSLKIVSFVERRFKKQMYSLFGLEESDVISKIESSNNTFFFPKTSSLGDHTGIDYYMRTIREFYNEITSKCPPIKKDISILYLPRGSLENGGLERPIHVQSQLVDYIKTVPNSCVYYTDTTQNMIEQINIVRRAQTIILDYGSNMMFNGFFAEGSQILVLNEIFDHLHLKNPRPFMLLGDSVKRGSIYYYACPSIPFDTCVKYVHIIEYRVNPYVHKLKCYKDCVYCKDLKDLEY
jgi:hypothetical protein